MSVIIAPIRIGIPKSIFNAIAPPSNSASEVDTDATIADESTDRETHRGICMVAASDKHRPVAIPRWATLCCKTMSMMVERVTIHKSSYP